MFEKHEKFITVAESFFPLTPILIIYGLTGIVRGKSYWKFIESGDCNIPAYSLLFIGILALVIFLFNIKKSVGRIYNILWTSSASYIFILSIVLIVVSKVTGDDYYYIAIILSFVCSFRSHVLQERLRKLTNKTHQ